MRWLILLCLLSTNQAFGKSSKIAPELQTKLESPRDVLVRFKGRADLAPAFELESKNQRGRFVFQNLIKAAEASQKKVVAFLKEQKVEHRAFYVANAVFVPKATSELMDKLATFEMVDFIYPNTKGRMELPSPLEGSKEAKEAQSNISYINADKVWSELGVKGEGIIVGGQDTGVQWDHPALKKQYLGYVKGEVDHKYHWMDAVKKTRQTTCKANSATPCDDNGHGTHTLGTVLGDDGGANKIGVAPGAKWIGCRNMDKGLGTIATYLECFEFFLAPYPMGEDPRTAGRPERAPHIINNSWGCPTSEGCYGEEFLDAIRAYQAAGIFVVVSAGNSGSRCGTVNDPPAFYSGEVVSVGAYRTSWGRGMASFSSRGPSTWNDGVGVDIVAPGVSVRSATLNNRYTSLQGTSMAGPHIAGVVALMWSANPKLIGKIDETKELLFQTASSVGRQRTCGNFNGSMTPNAVSGYGMVDALAAVKAAKNFQ